MIVVDGVGIVVAPYQRSDCVTGVGVGEGVDIDADSHPSSDGVVGVDVCSVCICGCGVIGCCWTLHPKQT